MGRNNSLKLNFKVIKDILGILSIHIEKNQSAICDIIDIIMKSEKRDNPKYHKLVMNTLEIFDNLYNDHPY